MMSRVLDPSEAKLRRRLRLFDVFAIASGAMVSSGLFVLPGLAHAKAGPAACISYLFAGFLAATGMLSKAELATAMPKAGGTYLYVTRSLGAAAGTVAGLMLWLSLALKSSFALVGMGVFVRIFVDVPHQVVAVALAVAFVAVNIAGVKEAARLQVILVTALLALLMLYIGFGMTKVSAEKLLPFVPYGWRAVFSTAGFVFISFGGVLKVGAVAEEVKSPGRNIPAGMSLALFVITFVYTFAVFVTAGVLDAQKLDSSLMPLYDGALAFLGPAGGAAMAVAAMFAFLTTANAGLLSASRYPVAMSRDGVLPPTFAKIHPKRGTPYVSVLTTGAIVIGAVFLHLEALVELASTVLILTFLFDNLTLIIMRESGLHNYRPQFKAPLYPWLQLAGIVGLAFLIAEMGAFTIMLTLASVLAGLVWYWFYGRIRATRETALMEIISRITSKKLTSGLLDAELRQIVLERNGIVADRLDALIEDAPVVDVPGTITMEELFRLAARKLAPKLGEKPENLYRLFVEREMESSTVLHEGLAIPHIIVDGERRFALMIVRCRGGIIFPGASAPVWAAFVMAGTRDERNFYLKALAAIVEATAAPDFARRWFAAKSAQALRDILQLGRRRRFGAKEIQPRSLNQEEPDGS